MRSNPSYFTDHQAADRIGVHRDTLRRKRADGTGPRVIKVGPRLVRYRPEDVDAWMEQHAQGGQGNPQ